MLGNLRIRRREDAIANSIALQPDDKLRIKLIPVDHGQVWKDYKLPETTQVLVQLDVDIVAEPVIPDPEAAYALLRHQRLNGQEQVECVRFAWAPNASRIELVAASDLLQGVVRRRALFQWRDVTRAGTLDGYAVQKIARTGATHVPLDWER
jgi:hypothetical protein